jgi:hypothetical protein
MAAQRLLLSVCTVTLWIAAWSQCTLVAAEDAPARQTTPTPTNTASYEETIHQALLEYELDHWAEAKMLFARAHDIKPNARTLRGLGLASYESRQYVEAISYFEQALLHHLNPLTPEMRQDVSRYLGQARQFVSRVELQVEPADAQLALDLGDTMPLPKDGVLLLDPGQHELFFAAPSYTGETRRLFADGRDVRMQVTLKPVAVVVAQPAALPAPTLVAAPGSGAVAPSAATRGDVAPPSNSLAPWFVVGISGVVAIAGGTMYAIALANKSQVTNPDQPARWSDYEDRYETGKVLFPLGATLFGVGLAGVATGLTLHFWPGSKSARDDTALTVGPGFVRIAGAL